MRSVINSSQITPFGHWIRQYLRESICVTNLDYVFEDYKRRKILFVEEKQNGGELARGQSLTFEALNEALEIAAPEWGYDYWGFYVMQFPKGCDMPGPGMRLNGQVVTCEDLRDHLNFQRQIVPPRRFLK